MACDSSQHTPDHRRASLYLPCSSFPLSLPFSSLPSLLCHSAFLFSYSLPFCLPFPSPPSSFLSFPPAPSSSFLLLPSPSLCFSLPLSLPLTSPPSSLLLSPSLPSLFCPSSPHPCNPSLLCPACSLFPFPQTGSKLCLPRQSPAVTPAPACHTGSRHAQETWHSYCEGHALGRAASPALSFKEAPAAPSPAPWPRGPCEEWVPINSHLLLLVSSS